MKTKKLLCLGAVIIGFLCVGNIMALDHGSMSEKGSELYPQRNGAAPGAALDGKSVDFKIVTIGEKTWAWTKLTGEAVSAENWASQLRYWEPAKFEVNLTNKTDNNRQTYGTTRSPNQNPLTITFFQSWNNEFYETGDFTYDYTKLNSSDANDDAAPELDDPVTVNQTALVLELSLSATDDSGDFFYYIVDEKNNFVEVSFLDNIKLPLALETAYNFSVYAVDFSGNMSEAKTVAVQPQETVNIVEGTAKVLDFKIDSRSLTELVIECTSNDKIGNAFVKITVNGTEVGEWKPDIDSDTGTNIYQIRVPANEIQGWGKDIFIGLNLGYIVMPIGDWGHYVLQNTTITEGENIDSPIFHKIGTGVDITEPQLLVCDNNLFDGITFNVGSIYYATTDSWVDSENYTADVTDNVFSVYLGDATVAQWQAQFRIVPDVPVAVTPGNKYAISMDVETSKDLPIYVKLYDTDDNSFLQIKNTTVSAPGETLSVYSLITCPDGLTKISQILFDFAWNAADTDFKISNITLCDKIKDITGLTGMEATGISVYQVNDFIIIDAENQIKSVQLYNVSGQLLPAIPDVNAINIAGLPKGIYLLKIQDILGNQQTIKVAVQ